MKINIIKKKPDALQKLFLEAPDLEDRIEMEKLTIMERILERMEERGMKRKDLAAAMEVSPARITTMLKGSNNFTLDTLIRAADAVGCELHTSFVPKGYRMNKAIFKDEEVEVSFRQPRSNPVRSHAKFASHSVSPTDETDAA